MGAMSGDQGDILWGPRTNSRNGGREAHSRVFIGLWKVSDWTLWRSRPSPKQKGLLRVACRHCKSTGHCQILTPRKRKERWHTDRLLGTSSLKEGSMWHVYRKPEMWSQQRQLLLANGSVNTFVAIRERVCRQAVSCVLQKMVTEAGDSSVTKRKKNVRCWKPLPSSAVKNVTESTSLCVIAICEV
jgi:hypothetical protein